MTVRLDGLKKLQCVVRVSVDDVDANRWIDVMRQRVFTDVATSDGEDVGRVEQLEHGLRLTSVYHEEQLVITLFLPHLLQCICQLHVGDLLRVLSP